MSEKYTEIPTLLLTEVAELVGWIECESERRTASNDPSFDFVARFRDSDLEDMQPLVKWIEYIQAGWAQEGEREHRRQHRYCTTSLVAED